VGSSFIERAEAALRGEPAEGVELVDESAPSLLDGVGAPARIALLATGFWAVAVFREGLTHPLDPLALLLRLLALAATLRVAVGLARLFAHARERMRRDRHRLALADEGLLLRTPRADFALPKHDIVDILPSGRGSPRWADVYLVTRPDSGRLYLPVGPFFGHTPQALSQRLLRWRGEVEPDTQAGSRAPVALPSKLFEAAARGEQLPGVAVIEHARGTLRNGPYATILLGVAMLEGLLRSTPAVREALGVVAPAVIALCLGAVPVLWLLLARRETAARTGGAMLLTPAELLLRTRAGVHRARWSDIDRIEIVTRRAWSIALGAHENRSLVLHRKSDQPIRYGETLLAPPVEVVAGLCEAYRAGVM